MSVTLLDDYRDRLAKLDPNYFIGSIIFFSISGVMDVQGKRTTVPVRVTRQQLEAWFLDLDLDLSYLPPMIKKVDAFRKASTLSSREYDLSEAETVKLTVEEIDYNPEFVLRHVFRTVHNKRTQVSSMAHVATLKFFRGARNAAGLRATAQHYKTTVNKVMVEIGIDGKPTGKKYPLEGAELQHVVDLVADFDQRYDDLAVNLQSDALRAVIRNYLTGLNAIGVKPTGGVYFVHNSRQRTLDALQELVRRIGQGCTFHQIPLLDTLDQREMLTEAFQTEVQDEVNKLLADISSANQAAKAKSRQISPNDYSRFMERYKDVLSRSEEYTRVLGLAQGRAGASLELALDAVSDMAGRLVVKSKPKP